MNFEVLLSKQLNNGYIARPVLWPDSSAHGETADQALAHVQQLIRQKLQQTQLVTVSVDLTDVQTDNPWATKAGIFADDPTWDEFIEEMAAYRKQVDDQEQLHAS